LRSTQRKTLADGKAKLSHIEFGWLCPRFPRFSVLPVRESAEYRYKRREVILDQGPGFSSFIGNTNKLLDATAEVKIDITLDLGITLTLIGGE